MRQRFVSALPKFLCVSTLALCLAACGAGGSPSPSSTGGSDSGPEQEGTPLAFNLKFPYGLLSEIRYSGRVAEGDDPEITTFNYSGLNQLSEHTVPGQSAIANEDKAVVEELLDAGINQINFISYRFNNAKWYDYPIKIKFEDRLPFYKNGQLLNERLEFNDLLVNLTSGSVASESLAVRNYIKSLYTGEDPLISEDDFKQYHARVTGSSTVTEVGIWQADRFLPKRQYVVVHTNAVIDASNYVTIVEKAFDDDYDGLFQNLVVQAKETPRYINIDIKMKLVDGVGAIEREYKFTTGMTGGKVLYNARYTDYDYSVIDLDNDHWVNEADRFRFEKERH